MAICKCYDIPLQLREIDFFINYVNLISFNKLYIYNIQDMLNVITHNYFFIFGLDEKLWNGAPKSLAWVWEAYQNKVFRHKN